MTSDQRRCIQRSRFVCRILNFCVKTSHAAAGTSCLHERGGGYMATSRMNRLRSGLRMSDRIAKQSFYKVKKVLLQRNTPVGTGIRRRGFAPSRRTGSFEALAPLERIRSDLR